MTIFETDEGYTAFERILSEAVKRFEMRLLSYCIMPNKLKVPDNNNLS